MFWSAQAVKGDVNFVGLLVPSLQICAPEGCFEATMIGGGCISAPQWLFKIQEALEVVGLFVLLLHLTRKVS